MREVRELFRSAGLLTAAAAGGQVVNLLATPAIAGLLGAATYGEYTVIVAAILTLAPVAGLRLDQAVVLPSSDKDATTLVFASFTASLGISLTFGALLYFVGIGPLTADTTFAAIPSLGALGLLAQSASQPLVAWLLRKARFLAATVVRFSQGLAQGLAPLAGAALAGSSLTFVLTGDTLARSASALLAFALCSISGFSLSILRRTRSNLLAILSRYWRHSLFGVPAVLLSGLTAQIPLLLLAYLADPVTVGHFALPFRLMVGGVSLIAAGIAQPFYAIAARLQRNGRNIADLSFTIYSAVLFLSGPAFVVAAVFGADLFALLLGPDWRAAGEFASLMSPWFLFWLPASSIAPLWLLAERQLLSLLFALADLVLRSLALVVGFRLGSPAIAVGTLAACSAFSSTLSGVLLLIFARVRARRALFRIALSVACVGVLFLIASRIRSLHLPLYATAASCTVLCAGYYLLLWRLRVLPSLAALQPQSSLSGS